MKSTCLVKDLILQILCASHNWRSSWPVARLTKDHGVDRVEEDQAPKECASPFL